MNRRRFFNFLKFGVGIALVVFLVSRLEDPAALWQAAFSSVLPAGVATASSGIALTPRLTGTDGFYFNALRRAP